MSSGIRWTLLCLATAWPFALVRAQETFDVSPAAQPDTQLNPVADPPQGEVVPVLRDYDRFQDKVTLRVEGIRPTITRGDSRIFLTAACSADGGAFTSKPSKVQITVLAVSDAYQYAEMKDDLQLIFLITKQAAPSVPLPRGLGGAASTQPSVRRVRVPARFQRAGMTKDKDPKALESFVAILDADVLPDLATGPIVEGQLGGAEFKFGPMEQLSLRRFAEKVKLLAPMPPADEQALDRALANGPVRADAVAMHLAQAKLDAAQEQLDKLTVTVMAKLEKDKAYRAATQDVEKLEAKKDKTPAGPLRADVSQQWLEAKAKVAAIKSAAMLDDIDLAAARRDVADAQAALQSLQRIAGGHEVRNAQK
jgi:hypothetical protein